MQRKMGEEEPAADRRTIPVCDGRNLVVGEGVAIEGHPIAKFGHPIRPVHPRPPIPGIHSQSPVRHFPKPKKLCSRVCRVKGTPCPAKITVLEKTKFEIGRGLKGKPFAMNQGLRVEGVKKAASDAVGLAGMGPLMNCWPSICPIKNSNRRGPSQPRMLGNLNGLTRLMRNILSGAALSLEDQRSAVPRPPPQALTSERYLPVRERQTHVGIQHFELIDRRLACIRWQLRQLVDLLNGLARRQRQRRQARRCLPFSAEVARPAAPGGVCGKAIY